MATVIAPFMPRRYNHNARGSATAQVTMPAHNPFEQRTNLANRPGAQLAGLQPSGALPGMGYLSSFLGDDISDSETAEADASSAAADAAAASSPAPATPAAAAPAGFNWNSLLTTGATAAGTVATAVLKDRYGNPVVPTATVAAKPASMMPWILGLGVVGLVVALVAFKK